MKKELPVLLVTLVLLVTVIVIACQNRILPENAPPDGGYVTITPGPLPAATGEPTKTAAAQPPPATSGGTLGDGAPGTAVGAPAATPAAVEAPGSAPQGSPRYTEASGPPTGTGQPPPPTAPPPFVQEWQNVAYKYIFDKYGVPASAIIESSVARRTLPLTNVVLVEGKVVGMQNGKVTRWTISIDQNGKLYEGLEAVAALDAAEKQAYAAKYGRLDAGLYDKLQGSGPQDLFRVLIIVKGGPKSEDVWATIAARYPEAHLTPDGYPTKDTPSKMIDDVIRPAYVREMQARSEVVARPLVEFLQSRGYRASVAGGLITVEATLPKAVILEVAQRPDVGSVYEPLPPPKPLLNSAVPSISAPSVWAIGTDASGYPVTGKDVKAGILEAYTVDFANPYLTGTVVGSGSSSWHPTYVAGVIVSTHPLYRGVAYGASVLSKVLTGNDRPDVYALVSSGASVINHSYAWDFSTFHAIDFHLDFSVRNDRVTHVAAVGNQASTWVGSPAKGYNVIGVGGYEDVSTVTWSSDTMYADSSWKNAEDKLNEKPEVVAVAGTSVYTTTSTNYNDGNSDWITDSSSGGTSLATPAVAGEAALLMQKDSGLKVKPEAVKAIIMASAIHNIEGSGRMANSDGDGTNRDGAGAVNADRAYRIVDAASYHHSTINMTNDFDSGYYKKSSPVVSLNKYQRLRVALAWDSTVDDENNPSSDTLASDLDVELYKDGVSWPVATSSSAYNSAETIDYVNETDDPSTYQIKVYKYSSSESANYLGLAWWTENRIFAGTSLTQEAASSQPTYRSVIVNDAVKARDPSASNNSTTFAGGLRSYDARVVYPPPSGGYSPILVLGILGNGTSGSAFENDPASTIQNSSGLSLFSATATSSNAQPVIKLARISIRLDDSAKKAYDLYQLFDELTAWDTYADGETINAQTAIRKQFQRGDAKEDFDNDASNDVTIADALYIAQYLAGTRSLDTLNAVNAASPQHDGDYDEITTTDANYISQYLASLRDEYFNWTGDSALSMRDGGRATVELGSLQLTAGGSGRIPIMIKNVTGRAGIGDYDLKLKYDPRVIRVTSVDKGETPFGAPAAFRIDNSQGLVAVNYFHTLAPGPTKDGVIAYLNVSAAGVAGQSAKLDVSVTRLSDGVGNKVGYTVTNGSVSIVK